MSLLPSALVLGVVALAALFQVLNRSTPPDRDPERRAASRALAIATAVQGAHFVEEAATGFPERLGAIFELPAMPYPVFVLFNMVWLGIWALSIIGLGSSRPGAFFAAWFLAIAGAVNGIAHPLLSVAADGYFPGLVTSFAIAAACIWLWTRLDAATEPLATAG